MAISASETQSQAYHAAAATTHSMVFGSNPANGELVVVVWRVASNLAANVTLTAPASGVVSVINIDRAASPYTLMMWVAIADGTATYKTWTITNISGNAEAIGVSWGGSWGASPAACIDKAVGTNNNAATSSQPGTTGTLSTAAELAISASATSNVNGGEISWDSGFASPGYAEATFDQMMASKKVTAATTALNPTATWTTSRTFAHLIGTFMEPVTTVPHTEGIGLGALLPTTGAVYLGGYATI